MTKINVNGLDLPPALVAAIESGHWQSLARSPKLPVVFNRSPVDDPSFYDEESLRRENKSWQTRDLPFFRGVVDGVNFPGNLDPLRSVLIADLGYDMPIALDYRQSPPSVVYLIYIAGREETNELVWIEACSCVEELIAQLS